MHSYPNAVLLDEKLAIILTRVKTNTLHLVLRRTQEQGLRSLSTVLRERLFLCLALWSDPCSSNSAEIHCVLLSRCRTEEELCGPEPHIRPLYFLALSWLCEGCACLQLLYCVYLFYHERHAVRTLKMWKRVCTACVRVYVYVYACVTQTFTSLVDAWQDVPVN